MRMRPVGLILAAAASAFVGFSGPLIAQQGTLVGTVTNTAGAAVNQAQISVAGGIGTLSNDQGRYSIGLPAGTYTIEVTHVAYPTTRYDDVAISAGQTTTLDIRLETHVLAVTGIVVTDNRHPPGQGGRLIESVNTIEVISGLDIRDRATTSLTDHLKGKSGVDVIPHGLQAANIVVRGFNNIFSGALHMLSDYRLAGVPSLRVNLMHFIPTVDEDIERIEVVLGPASALYGPNTANGVVHILSRSPLTSQGTTVTFGTGAKTTGGLSAFQGAFRSAFLLSDNFGFKVTGQYLTGEEWAFVDPVEETGRLAALADPAGCLADQAIRGESAAAAQIACDRVGRRDFDIERYSVETRADWRFADDGTFIATYGRNSSSGIELTGLGAGQTSNWISEFYQARMNKGRFFAQTYYNASDAGDSFLLRDGTALIDNSSLTVGQIQHGFDVAEGRQDFTYGFDYYATRPNSQGSIYGTYETDAANGGVEMNEWGVYLQSKTAITPKLDFIFAGRMDNHSVLPEGVFSPRAALVFKPNEDNGIRLSYNRAFSTPSALNYFLDISGGTAPAPIGALGYGTRAHGSGRNGWGLQNADGTLRGMRSPFTPASLGGPATLLPADVAVMWQLMVGVMQAQGAIDAPTAGLLASLSPTNSDIARLAYNTLTEEFTPVASLVLPDIPSTLESNTETYEVGWTGVINDRVSISADLYYMKKNNFVSPLLVQTPLLFLNGADIAAFLTPVVGAAAAGALAAGGAMIPLGVVSSDESGARGPELIVSYRNVGDINLWGGDISIQAFLTNEWIFSATYSHVSDDTFPIDDGTPITLNAPGDKGSIGVVYRNVVSGFNTSARLRFASSFQASSAGFVGDVDSSVLVDFTAGYKVPNSPATLQLSISNVFNADYQSFVGVPEIGRFVMLKVKYDLF